MLSADQRKLLTTGIAVVAGCALAWHLLVDRNPPKQRPQVAQMKGMDAKEKKQPVRVAQADEQPLPLPPPMPVIKPRPQTGNLPPLESPNPNPITTEIEIPLEELDPLTPLEPVVPLQVARLALGFVGADPQAEELWYAAINDPNMPANARQDLIEDLNEEGFADPRNVTEDDLPLIYSRLALIEQVAPDAFDDVNAAAFAEAYKDLVNMVFRLEQEAMAREEAQAAGQDITGSPPRRPFRR
jgi:hypothetical protein